MSIVIRPDNQVDVLAPSRMPATLIDHFVQDKQAWIQKKLRFNTEIRAKYQPKLFVEGESFDLLGKAYPLKLVSPASETHIDNGKLITATASADNIKIQLTRWYHQEAETHFRQRCAHFAPMVGKAPILVGIKAYKSRWGSCHHDGRIYFNWRLIMAPVWVIDDVIIHELCHLIHPNHSKVFWQEVARINPDHKKSQTWLKTNSLLLEL